MKCEIAGCEEDARFRIEGIGLACGPYSSEVLEDLQMDEEDLSRL